MKKNYLNVSLKRDVFKLVQAEMTLGVQKICLFCMMSGQLFVLCSQDETVAEVQDGMGWDGIFGYLTSHEAYCLGVGNRSGHNLHTRG